MISIMSTEQRGELLTAIYEYARTRERPNVKDPVVKVAFASISGQINRDSEKYLAKCEKNKENGSKAHTSDRKRTDANASDRKQTQANSADNDTDNDNDNDTDTDTESESDIIARGRYKNVRISDAEYAELSEELGGAVCDRVIERLSEYIQTNGDKYRDHTAVVRKWAREDGEKKSGADSSLDADEYLNAALERFERNMSKQKATASVGDTA